MYVFKKYALFFSIGGIGYAVLELLWRGRTHWSMVIAGGLCFSMFSVVSERLKSRPLFVKALICAFGITVIELLFGIFFNMLLDMNVWDYSDMPLNFMGQICPYFSFLWCILALLFIPLAELINNKLETT